MKKLIVGLAAVGALLVLRPALKRKVMQKMQAHCNQMAGKCKEMMGGQGEATDHAAMREKMREHCEEMAAQHEERAEPAVAA